MKRLLLDYVHQVKEESHGTVDGYEKSATATIIAGEGATDRCNFVHSWELQ